MMTLQSKEGWETHKHPNPALANICVDCPHCGREEWFLLFSEQAKAIVTCQSGNAVDPRNCYIVQYKV